MAFLVGQQGTGWTLASAYTGSAGYGISYASGYTATAGTASTAYFHCGGDATATSTIKVAVYDAANNLVGVSNAMSFSNGSLVSASFSTPITLTVQTYYLIAIPGNGTPNYRMQSGSYAYAGYQYDQTAMPYSSPPATRPSPTADSGYEPIIWLDGTEGSPSVKKLKLLAHGRRRNAA